MTQTAEKPLSTGDVAGRLRCSINTVIRLCKAGSLPHWMSGCHRRFNRADVEQYAAANRIPAPGTPLVEPTRPLVVLVAAMSRAEELCRAIVPGSRGLAWQAGEVLTVAHLAGIDPPDAVVIGSGEGLGLAVRLAEILLATPSPPAVAIVLGEDLDPWDQRLSAVRSRLKWLGMESASWDGVLADLGLSPGRACAGTPAPGEPEKRAAHADQGEETSQPRALAPR